MNPVWQIVNVVVGGAVLAALVALAKLVANKADKSEVARLNEEHKSDDVKEHNNVRESITRLEVKLEAALLVVGASITRPELAEKILAMTGRSDDRMARVMADIVQLFAASKENARANVDTEKRLDDLPARVRTIEDEQKRNG